MKIREHPKLKKWPPGWAAAAGKGDTFPIGDNKGTLKVAVVVNGRLHVTGDFDGRSFLGLISSEDSDLLDRVCRLMNENKGKPLKEIGDLEVGEIKSPQR